MNVKQGIIVNIKTMNYMPAKKRWMMFVSEVFGETGLERAKQQRFGDEHRTIHKL